MKDAGSAFARPYVDALLEETRALMQRTRDELAATAGPPIG